MLKEQSNLSFVLIIYFLLCTSCSQLKRAHLQSPNRYSALLQEHPLTQLSKWSKVTKKKDKQYNLIYQASPDLNNYCYHLRKASESKNSNKCVNNDYDIIKEEVKLNLAIKLLPYKLQRYIKRHALGFVIIDDVNFAIHVLNLKRYIHPTQKNIIFINQSVFEHSMEQWYLVRELSILKDVSFLEVEFSNHSETHNNKNLYNIQFQIFRAIALIINTSREVINKSIDLKETVFTKLSWSLIENAFFPKQEISISEYFELNYSNSNKLISKKEYVGLAKELKQKTNFVTPYASINPIQDFTDGFSFYIHTQIMKRPFKVSSYGNKLSNSHYWTQARNKNKTDFYRRLYKEL